MQHRVIDSPSDSVNDLHILSTLPIAFTACAILVGFTFEPRFLITLFSRRFICSKCKSHGILHPILPIVLTKHPNSI